MVEISYPHQCLSQTYFFVEVNINNKLIPLMIYKGETL